MVTYSDYTLIQSQINDQNSSVTDERWADRNTNMILLVNIFSIIIDHSNEYEELFELFICPLKRPRYRMMISNQKRLFSKQTLTTVFDSFKFIL